MLPGNRMTWVQCQTTRQSWPGDHIINVTGGVMEGNTATVSCAHWHILS